MKVGFIKGISQRIKFMEKELTALQMSITNTLAIGRIPRDI